jgi:hypothetical protein
MASTSERPGFAGILADPEVRRAYVTTKVCVVGAAALLTWPLSSFFGVRAWYGFAVFAGLMLLVTIGVLAIGRSVGDSAASKQPDESDDDEASDPGEPVVLAIEDSIDLHSFPPAEIPAVVSEYLVEAQAQGFREVRVIHGRGIGVQRERVRSLLAKSALVCSFADAPPDRGGWGATVVVLTQPAPGNGPAASGGDG